MSVYVKYNYYYLMQQYLPIAGNPVNQTTKNHPMEVKLWGWPYPLSLVIYLIYQSITKYVMSKYFHAPTMQKISDSLEKNHVIIVC